ncbi:hypothetical protein DQ04_00061280 [Trypanosoma grayi]|uniref:hypothetical protein n=1 Tax=Trypanosoma grayi TaxID=71804 RepID=UPI0004F46C49|nr:hypothetical protein DQ04_00061280 [Trypanosoma grayi]KEG15490.1 hypothetical protein DQ04_00061280 [Trypanosoma grayi]
MHEQRHGQPLACSNAKENGCMQDPDVTPKQSKSLPSREMHRQQVLFRAQQLLEQKKRDMENRQQEKERKASEVKSNVTGAKLEEVRCRNRLTEYKAQHAKLLQANQQCTREENLRGSFQRLQEASNRQQNGVLFQKLRTTQQLVSSLQRAKVNRSSLEAEAAERRRICEEREEARQKAVEEERIAREIELEQRRLLHDERALKSIEFQQQQELLLWEKGQQRQREHEERLWRHRLQKMRERSERMQHGARESSRVLSSRPRDVHGSSFNSQEKEKEKGSRGFHRVMTSPGFYP